jgi:sugar transferase (PEP-CTERM/EpsH1 system associated)
MLRGVLALPTTRPLTHVLLDAPGLHDIVEEEVERSPPDLVVSYCSGIARLAFEAPLDRYPLMIDMVDVDSVKWTRMAAKYGPPLRWVYAREARTLRAFEVAAVRRAAATIVVNEREKTELDRIAPGGGVTVVPNGIDLDAFRPSQAPANSSTVVFCGVMNYAPNEAGVQWFAREVWPLVRARRPDARFQIVGLNPSRAVQQLHSPEAGVEVVGGVPAVQPYLWNAALSIAPLHLAQGLQNKVLEALAAGLPVVATTAVAHGLPKEALSGCDVADDPAGFASHVTALLEITPARRRARADSAALSRLSWEASLAGLEPILRTAAARH